MPRLNKTQKAALDAANLAAYQACQRQRALLDLAWKVSRARDLDHDDALKLVNSVVDGTVTLDPQVVAAEVEAFIGTLRCHEHCKDHVRTYGNASYHGRPGSGYSIDPSLCEVCGQPMKCAPGRTAHEWTEMSGEECRRNKLFHGGNCYHVSLCKHCGAIHAVDSSD